MILDHIHWQMETGPGKRSSWWCLGPLDSMKRCSLTCCGCKRNVLLASLATHVLCCHALFSPAYKALHLCFVKNNWLLIVNIQKKKKNQLEALQLCRLVAIVATVLSPGLHMGIWGVVIKTYILQVTLSYYSSTFSPSRKTGDDCCL